ncbi:MAG: NAD(P)/FAD-dependent oxidoreductase [Bacteroidales bacterium]|nr:NAD(P)/FAD-dependent oxidoreductase [Bacteroidales bacterium]
MDTNIVIIGAGVVGLAIAQELSKWFDDVYLIEKNTTFGQETSSRNSEVIHSGIYYPKGSLKATICVEGKKLLYDYCLQKQIAHKKIGKLVVSTNASEDTILYSILQQAQNNNVTDAQLLSLDEIKQLEPHINATTALYFPSTGIVDSFSLMKQLENDAINQGVQVLYKKEITAIRKITNGYELTVNENDEQFSFTASIVINAGGLYADKIAAMVGIHDLSYTIHYWKGEYFSVTNGKHKLLNHLIYPTPNPNNTGLGIHATLDINSRLKLGPNALYLNTKILDYSVNKDHLESFYNAAIKFLPFIELHDLQPDQAGVRPKLQKPGDTFRDFIICNETNKGFKNFINLIGIESPGLTSCLAIAKKVKKLIQ